MIGLLLLLFIVLPFVELTLLLWLGDKLGWLPALGIIIATGVLGAALVRLQGWLTLRNLRSEFSQGRLPTDALWDAGMILLAGALLITPGVLTDAFGFSLLVPPCRWIYRRWLTSWAKKRFAAWKSQIVVQQAPIDVEFSSSDDSPQPPPTDHVIEAPKD